MELVEIIRGGQDAMDRGDYRLAVAASSHVLETFPSCLTAHRMLGEAQLEQGQTDAAIEHFNRALEIDPLNVVARLGLGVAAEENKAMNDAYSAYLHAWEINPALDQVRDELVRLRGLLGGDERLHPTRAGLAGIFIRGGQFGRAAAEWRAVLIAEPDNERARTSLAEVLWRSGDDTGALAASRDVLRDSPENVRALSILADIETRRGNAVAAEYVDRYQFGDPAGEILTLLSEWRDDLDLSFLRRESMAMPEFDFSETPLAERVPVAGAAAATSGSVPGLGASQFAAPDLWDTLVQDLKPGEESKLPGAALEDDVVPFSWQDDAELVSLHDVEPFTIESSNGISGSVALDLPAVVAPSEPTAAPSDLSFEAEFAAMNSGNIDAAPSAVSAESTSDLERFVAPPTPEPAQPLPDVAQAPAGSQFVTADGRVDLTVGWDDLDRELRDATPTFDNATEMDELSAQLGVEGIQPFDVGESPFDETAWAPFTDDDLGVSSQAAGNPRAGQPVSETPASHSQQDVAWADPVLENVINMPDVEPRTVEPPAATSTWDMDDELVSAIPSQQASGYTEILRHVDTEVPQEVVLGEEVDPFANPDSAGTPLEFEDLLAVTSSDGTSELTEPDATTGSDSSSKSEADLWAEELAAVQQMTETGWPAEAIPDIPLDQSPFDLEELLRGEVPAAASDTSLSGMHSAQPAAENSLDAVFADLGDVQPFSLDDEAYSGDQVVMADVVDFSDINEAPFDPSTLPGVVSPALPVAAASEPWELADEPTVEAVELSPMWAESEDQLSSILDEPVTDSGVADDPELESVSTSSRIGLTPSGVAWPAFVSHTSLLIDRGTDRGNLFARLRESKRAAAATGLTAVERSLSDLRPAGTSSVGAVSAAPGQVAAAGGPRATIEERRARLGSMTEEERLDLMAMRIRLIEDESSAEEVAKMLEAAIARGMNDPLALRVLGEAYLKLGRNDQAANQFRNAMLARQRAR